ncbi:hypothetical protein HYH03_011657 [Edaphochlamys debaryana]|uniref:Uncharacterized protein n=1 Tax=Edaphochlamys debaryana TaxID=47281 RepID=A0A835XU86_9CHLO|nr:hypothetical protein HYH03_011657 [Edaphochlamys debaryana]|eukprot:KAG2489854.1 hypothetical protein HYH03_011657 [Edaphochlamys debaryana]
MIDLRGVNLTYSRSVCISNPRLTWLEVADSVCEQRELSRTYDNITNNWTYVYGLYCDYSLLSGDTKAMNPGCCPTCQDVLLITLVQGDSGTGGVYSTCLRQVTDLSCYNACTIQCRFLNTFSVVNAFALKNPQGCRQCTAGGVYGWCGTGVPTPYCCVT